MDDNWEVILTEYYKKACKKLAKKLYGKDKKALYKVEEDLRAASIHIRKDPLHLGDLHHDSGSVCPDGYLLQKYRKNNTYLNIGAPSAYRILALIHPKSHKIYLLWVYWKRKEAYIETDRIQYLVDEFNEIYQIES